MQTLRHFASVIGLLVVATGAAAQDQEEPPEWRSDRPGAPIDPRVILVGPTEVDIAFMNTATEGVVFQVEITLEGKRVHADFERRVSQEVLRMHGVGESRTRVTSDLLGGYLRPGSDFCFRAWSRTRSITRPNAFESDDVQSPHPSAWACGVLLPNKPPHPTEVISEYRACVLRPAGSSCRPGFKDRAVLVRWVIPAFPYGTTIDRLVVEKKRYLPTVTDWEADLARDYRFQHGLQYPKTDGEFLSPPKQAGSYMYRVCLENAAGRECGVANLSLLVENPTIQGRAQTPGVAVPEAATPMTTATAYELENPNTRRAREAAPTSAVAVAEASEARGSTSRVDPSAPVTLNPQPLPPKTVDHATQTRAVAANPQQASPHAMVNPGSNVALNPQPLPPKTTILQPRTPAIVPSGPMQTTIATTRAVTAQGQIQATASRLPTYALGQNVAKDVQLICRGSGTRPGISAFYKPASDGAAQQMMYFIPAGEPARADGSGLAPGSCSLSDRTLPDTGAQIILFKATAAEGDAVGKALTPTDGYWRFDVRKHESGSFKDEGGFYEATTQGKWAPAAAELPTPNAGAPVNLLEADESAMVIMDGKQMTAANARKQIEAELRQATGPIRPVHVARPVPTALHIPPALPGPPALPAPPAPPNGPATFTQTAAPIQGVGTGAGRAAALQMDCTTNVPRISNVQGRITPNARFTINGSCFGTSPGSVLMIGQFPSGNLSPAFAQWTESAIVVEMPGTDVPSHTIALSVRRSVDGKVSPAKQAQFSAALHALNVSSESWSPSGLFFNYAVAKASGDPVGGWSSFGPKAEQRSTRFRLAVNPACALETLDVPATIGTVNAVNGWERGPAHQADVEVVWTPACRIYSMNYVVAATHERHCSGAFELKARASCPTGVTPQ